MGGLVYGVLAGGVCYAMVQFIKHRLAIDDSLDVFAVHGVGGILGILLVAFFALPSLGGLGLAEGMTAAKQFGVQLLGVGATVVWTAVWTVIIVKLVEALVGLRVSIEAETEGLDLSEHGERGYHI